MCIKNSIGFAMRLTDESDGHAMTYELRFKCGAAVPLGPDPSLTDDQEQALSSGAAQLVRTNPNGDSTVVLDVDDITEVSSSARGTGSSGPAPLSPSTPLLSIRVLSSDSGTVLDGREFDTLTGFDTAVQAELALRARGHVVFLINWKDGTTFEGCYDWGNGLYEYLIDHLIRVCGAMVDRRHDEVAAAGTLLRVFAAALAEATIWEIPPALPEETSSAPNPRFGFAPVPAGPPPSSQRVQLQPVRQKGHQPSATRLRYTTEGVLRGRCGHHHKKLESAVDCLDADESRCVSLGGHTDRKIFAVGPGVKRELNDEERRAVAVHRLLGPGIARA